MAHYDVYESNNGNLLLDVQADFLDTMRTRLVVPMILYEKAPRPVKRLNPVFDIGKERYVMITQLIAAIPVTELKVPVANILQEHDAITAALDMVFHGF